MDLQSNKDYFEEYLELFPDSPSLVLVRSVELRNFPKEFLKEPILDLCCGDGCFSTILGLKNIAGCDIDGNAIKKAEKKGIYNELIQADVRNLPFEDNSFYTVFANCALEHVEDIEIALKEVSRVLKPEGVLIMTVPSELLLEIFPPKKFLERIGFKKLGKKILDNYNKKQAHRNIYNFNEWKNLLNKAGLNPIRHFYLFDVEAYKIAVFCDWLSTLRIFNITIRLLKLFVHKDIRKLFWRKLLKKYYLQSTPLEKGGELVIVARNEK